MAEGYCKPVSVQAGDAIEFKISAGAPYEIVFERLRVEPDGTTGPVLTAPQRMPAGIQKRPDDPSSTGCVWVTTYPFRVPVDWQSGLYAARCTEDNGDVSHVVFVVRPASPRGDLAVLANTITWNAYNNWSPFKYKPDFREMLSFERPSVTTPPAWDPANPDLNHTTLAELWVLTWLEDQGYLSDVYSDGDLHRGRLPLSKYRVLLLNTHPEYWTMSMLDFLEGYLNGGGTLLYLGGNGVFEQCGLVDDPDVALYWGGDSSLPRERNYLRNLTPPRPERNLLGVAYRFNNWLDVPAKPGPFRVLRPAHRFFDGATGRGGGPLAEGDLLGEVGLNHRSNVGPDWGAACGWEFDSADGATARDGEIVNAWLPGAPTNFGGVGSDRGTPPANIEVLAVGQNEQPEGPHAGHMTCYRHAGGGFVFTAGSITFGGSLVVDVNLQQVVCNAIDEGLGWRDFQGTKYAGIWEQRGGPPWVERHGLSPEEYQQLVDDLAGQGYRPLHVSGHSVGGEDRYATIWEQRDGPPWIARHRLTGAQYQQVIDDLSGQGYRPIDVSAYTVAGEDRFATIWEQRQSPPWVERHGLRSQEYQQLVEALAGQGFRPLHVSGHSIGGEGRYATIWEQRDGPPWVARHRLTAAEYQQVVDDLVGKGYRPIDTAGYAIGGEDRYATIWEQRDGPPCITRHGLPSAEYQRASRLVVRDGFVPITISGYSAMG
jgi:hypothetical protein